MGLVVEVLFGVSISKEACETMRRYGRRLPSWLWGSPSGVARVAESTWFAWPERRSERAQR